MLPDSNISAELAGISPLLAQIPKSAVLQVPEEYFEELPLNILMKISDIRNNRPLLPVAYFETLPGLTLEHIHRIEETSTLLAPARHLPIFTVPEGYFSRLPENIRRSVPQTARVVEISRENAFFRYAVAACITGILGLGLFSTLNDTQHPYNPEFTITEANKILKENSYNQVLESVTEQEITHFLQSGGQDVSAALLASVADDKNLPEEDEYMYDDQTLDRLMNNLQIEQAVKN